MTHDERVALIHKPFPRLSTTFPGKSYGGSSSDPTDWKPLDPNRPERGRRLVRKPTMGEQE